MLFPFRTSAIFRNRWVALLWAAGICFMAAQVVDSISGATGSGRRPAEASAPPVSDAAPTSSPVIATPPASGPLDGHIAR